MGEKLYEAHKEDFAGALERITSDAIANPVTALCQSLSCLELLSASLSKNGRVRLFKYQPYSDRNVEDFLGGVLHMATPNSFNDINEGWQRFDEGVFQAEIEKARSVDIRNKLSNDWAILAAMLREVGWDVAPGAQELIASMWERTIGDQCATDAFCDDLIATKGSGQSLLRAETWCASLSETVVSAGMWDRYAHGHTGFALEYEFFSFSPECRFGKSAPPYFPVAGLLMPVTYGRRVDLSPLFPGYCLAKLLQGRIDNLSFITTVNMFARKALEWSCEREWRIVTRFPGSSSGCVYVVKKPIAVYAGIRMEIGERKRLVEAADSIGLRVYPMDMDCESEDYSLKVGDKPLEVG